MTWDYDRLVEEVEKNGWKPWCYIGESPSAFTIEFDPDTGDPEFENLECAMTAAIDLIIDLEADWDYEEEGYYFFGVRSVRAGVAVAFDGDEYAFCDMRLMEFLCETIKIAEERLLRAKIPFYGGYEFVEDADGSKARQNKENRLALGMTR